MIAARNRALASGSGRPILAATVISRASLENRLERFLSCAPFRYMMFLYLLWPAIAARPSFQSSSLREAKRRSNPGFAPRLRAGLLRYARNDGFIEPGRAPPCRC